MQTELRLYEHIFKALFRLYEHIYNELVATAKKTAYVFKEPYIKALLRLY